MYVCTSCFTLLVWCCVVCGGMVTMFMTIDHQDCVSAQHRALLYIPSRCLGRQVPLHCCWLPYKGSMIRNVITSC